jgi:hypothetical protein
MSPADLLKNMKSKIRVEFDFDKKEPYLQLYLEEDNQSEIPDLRDSMLKAFVQTASNSGITIKYPETNVDNCCPQIRLISK